MISNLTTYHKGKEDPTLLSPLNLAFIGDTVFNLLVQEKILSMGNRPVGKLHAMCAQLVCAQAQAQAAEKILPTLSREETDVFKRGRNANPGHRPKNANLAQYRAATGFEALIGWLYLSGDFERLHEIFNLATQES